MRAEESNDMIKKYLEAKTTISEEKELLDSLEPRNGVGAWSAFARQNKIEAPSGLKESVRTAIHGRKRQKQRMWVSIGIAASIVLFVSVFFNITNYRSSEYREKEAQLQEAISMFTPKEEVPAKKNIIYEDEMLIIYLASN